MFLFHSPLVWEIVGRRYERAWDDMNDELRVARRPPAGATKPHRPTDHKIDEILEISRFLQRSLPVAGVNIPRLVRQEPSRREVTDQLRQVESVLAEMDAELVSFRTDSYGISELIVSIDDDPQVFRAINEQVLKQYTPRTVLHIQQSSSPSTIATASSKFYDFDSGGNVYEVKRPPRKATVTPPEENPHNGEGQAGDDHAT
jgi:hypothetical protein